MSLAYDRHHCEAIQELAHLMISAISSEVRDDPLLSCHFHRIEARVGHGIWMMWMRYLLGMNRIRLFRWVVLVAVELFHLPRGTEAILRAGHLVNSVLGTGMGRHYQ